jgi:hypothetical protein
MRRKERKERGKCDRFERCTEFLKPKPTQKTKPESEIEKKKKQKKKRRNKRTKPIIFLQIIPGDFLQVFIIILKTIRISSSRACDVPI